MFENLRDVTPGTFSLDPATVVFEQQGDCLFAYHTLALLRDNRFEPPLRLRWSHQRVAWFLVRGNGTTAG